VPGSLSEQVRNRLVALFSRMRSGRGFLNDVEDLRTGPDLKRLPAAVTQAALVIAGRHDGGVPFAHARALTAALRRAELVESRADSHFVWFADDWPTIAEGIRSFLRAGPDSASDSR
jgi:pimeloyl-ACP methyl ester carboxylesterase